VATGAFTIIAYALSPQFREKKAQPMDEPPKRKISGSGNWQLVPWRACHGRSLDFVAGTEAAPAPVLSTPGNSETGTNSQLTIKARPGSGATNQVKIAVKNGGIAKVLHTKSLHELGQAIRENVTVLGPNRFRDKTTPFSGSGETEASVSHGHKSSAIGSWLTPVS